MLNEVVIIRSSINNYTITGGILKVFPIEGKVHVLQSNVLSSYIFIHLN